MGIRIMEFPEKAALRYPLRESPMLYLFAGKSEYPGLKCLQTAKLAVTRKKKLKIGKRNSFDLFKIFLHFSYYNWETQNY